VLTVEQLIGHLPHLEIVTQYAVPPPGTPAVRVGKSATRSFYGPSVVVAAVDTRDGRSMRRRMSTGSCMACPG
jgi:hypothetical protein